ncbi:four-carbon acid sugar kinase family protein [Paraburkholderia sp. MMS20-SJTR3]|uniref:Four-carbon acid sugar kinase family protein n=1 Tax=Paraburkholderia sejongensis TaxID=2886946 RepID=A0ABS8JR73_9BURK|nr:four-carbon acid sugar kinase family protein [Paraburkholderia sp. MMS20-SJTR3]MCC8392250.1 four-carbon acid sugar kinase family protein [Paraburkholderia sp. MMS20-SJTR3]
MKLLIIADDLSGAADCAIGFAHAGHRTVVTLRATREHAHEGVDTIAVDTDTRRLTPDAAAARTRAAYAEMSSSDQRLYKKIDSTLRGNWAAEVAGLQPLAGVAIVAPAFPAMGRTVQGGRVFVHGEPLETTATWQLEHAGVSADIATQLTQAGLLTQWLDAEALREQPQELALRIDALAARGVEALVVDTQTEQALHTLATACLRSRAPFFWVGSGGLAREIATLETRDRADGTAGCAAGGAPGQAAFPGGPILILVGSLSAVSERQCALLRERGGVEELIVPPPVLRSGASHPDWHALQQQIAVSLRAGCDLLLRIGRDDGFDPAEGMQLSTALAQLVAPHFTKAGGLIATGGETARAMLAAAQIGSLQLLAEVEAGVAVARPLGGAREHCPGIVTKAGAFGTDHALYAAWLTLRNETEPGAAPR